MKSLSRAASPEEFAYLLYLWMKKWRGSASGNGSVAANRFAKNVRRRYIRQCKLRFRLNTIPSFGGARSEAMQWQTGAAEDVKIVFLPQSDAEETAGRHPQPEMRRDMHRLLGAAMLRDSHTTTDLISSANSNGKRLPSIGRSFFSGRERLRGLYLEGLGVAILPGLNAENIEALRAQGALVLDNSLVSMEMPTGQVSKTMERSDAWHLQHVSADSNPYTGKGVTIGVLDSGIDRRHPEFAGKSIQFMAFTKAGVQAPHIASKDFGHHGTHVSGICAGRKLGIARDAHLSVAAVLTIPLDNGRIGGFVAQIVSGLNWLTNQAGPAGIGVDIINASLGFNTRKADDFDALYAAVSAARLQGKLTIAAIGNDGRKGLGKHGMPGKFNHVVAVGAIDRNDEIAAFSDWGPAHASKGELEEFKPDIVAPGVEIVSAVPNSGFLSMNGTSMAAPIVAGAAARLIESDESLRTDPERLTNRLIGLTIPLLPPAHIDKRRYGRGRLDLAKI